jgi:nucleoside-diphosphate-sugar epimerase
MIKGALSELFTHRLQILQVSLSYDMAVIQPPAKVLVSGANGFVAIWVVKSLLEKGYAVRGTVRSTDKGEHLAKLFSNYGDKLELVVVEDIAKVG